MIRHRAPARSVCGFGLLPVCWIPLNSLGSDQGCLLRSPRAYGFPRANGSPRAHPGIPWTPPWDPMGLPHGSHGPPPQNISQNAIFIDFHKKIHPQTQFYKDFSKKYIRKYDFIKNLKKHPKIRFYMTFLNNTSQNTILYAFFKKIHPKIRFYNH